MRKSCVPDWCAVIEEGLGDKLRSGMTGHGTGSFAYRDLIVRPQPVEESKRGVKHTSASIRFSFVIRIAGFVVDAEAASRDESADAEVDFQHQYGQT